MSESERRRKYRYNRVLIESERILTPQFDDSIVYLTGPQIEMLRNVTQYLNRLDTYVETHHSGYYLTPDAADYDDILEIVADLEETLMGNPNTIWGYKDAFAEVTADPGTSETWKYLYNDAVPAGYVYVITSVSVYFTTGTASRMKLSIDTEHYTLIMDVDDSPTVHVPLALQGAWPLKEGERMLASVLVSGQPCAIRLDMSGYKMVVP